jgi:hypothetical protein
MSGIKITVSILNYRAARTTPDASNDLRPHHSGRWRPPPALRSTAAAMYLRSSLAANTAGALVVLTTVLQLALTYILQSRWRDISTLPFLSDATYDSRQLPVFITTTAVTAAALLLAAAAAAAAQRRRAAAAVGLAAVAVAAASATAASAIHADRTAHWRLASVAFGASLLRAPQISTQPL